MTSPILSWALPIALFLLVAAMVLCLARLLRGPAAQDRVLALDCMYLNGMLLMLALGIYYGSANYFEAAMLIALLGFASSTAMAKFLLRGEVIECPRRPCPCGSTSPSRCWCSPARPSPSSARSGCCA